MIRHINYHLHDPMEVMKVKATRRLVLIQVVIIPIIMLDLASLTQTAMMGADLLEVMEVLQTEL